MFRNRFTFVLINAVFLVVIMLVVGCEGAKEGQLIDFGGVRLSDPMPTLGVPVISKTLGNGMLVKMPRESMGCTACCVFPSADDHGRIGVIRFKREGNVKDWTQKICDMIPVKYKIDYLTRMGQMAEGFWVRTGKDNLNKSENLLNVFVVQEAGDDVVIFASDGSTSGHGLISIFAIDKTRYVDTGELL